MRGTLLIVVVLSAVFACGPASAPSSPQAADAPPKSGGVLSTREQTNYTNMDPTLGLRGEATHVTNRAYAGLLRFRSGPDVGYEKLVIEPNMAERWEASPDAKAYTFHLRKGVRFAPGPPMNGREVTSEDWKWSTEYTGRTGPFKDVKFPSANQIAFKVEGLEAVETPDPATLRLRFKDGFAPFLSYAATAEVTVFAKEAYEEGTFFTNKTAGTGPWQYDPAASQQGTRLVWKKNPNYWEAGKPYVDELRTLTIIENAPAKAAFQTKQLDVLHEIDTPNEAQAVRSAAAGANEVEYLGWNAVRLYYNINRAPFNDLKFRKAFAYAIDRDEYLKTFMGGKGRWSAAGAAPETFTQEELKQMLKYDPEESKKLLRETGYDGAEIEYLYSDGYGEQLLNDSLLLQSQLKKVGINMGIKTMERNDISNRRRNGNYSITSVGLGPGLEPDVDYLVYGYWHPKSNANYYHVNDPRLTELVEATRREGDPAKRNEAVRRAARYINDNTIGIWIYFGVGYHFWHPHVKGFHPNQANRGRPEPMVWIDK